MKTTKEMCELYGIPYDSKNGNSVNKLRTYLMEHGIVIRTIGRNKGMRWIT